MQLTPQILEKIAGALMEASAALNDADARITALTAENQKLAGEHAQQEQIYLQKVAAARVPFTSESLQTLERSVQGLGYDSGAARQLISQVQQDPSALIKLACSLMVLVGRAPDDGQAIKSASTHFTSPETKGQLHTAKDPYGWLDPITGEWKR